MAAAVSPVAAHSVPLEVVVFVKAEGAAIRVLARMPAPFLADARLPRREDGYLDLANIDGPMAGVASYVARTLDVMSAGRPLALSSSAWNIARFADSSFERYDTANARLSAARPGADIAIDPDKAAVDLAFEYALPPGAAPDLRLSLRVDDFRAANRDSRMRVIEISGDGSARTLVTTGSPRRIELEPASVEVFGLFSRLGVAQFALAGDLLLFVLCLAIPRRRLSETLPVFAALAAGWLLALAGSSVVGVSLDASGAIVVRAFGAAALVVAALQNITPAREVWRRATAGAFGVFQGVLFGAAYGADLPLAGAHSVIALTAYAAPVLAGALWLLLLAKAIVDLVYRTKIPERWALVLLSFVPIHTGLHGILGIVR
jgi:hypothetical protein